MTGHGPSLIFEDRSRTVSTTRNTETIEVFTRDQRRRRWSLAEKATLVRRTSEAGRDEGVACGPAGRRCRELAVPVAQARTPGRIDGVSAGEAVVPASELSAARAEIAKLQRVLGK